MSGPRRSPERVRLAWLIGFAVCCFLGALALQLPSPVPPWEDSSPVDSVTAGVLWMLSLTCLLHVDRHLPHRGPAAAWALGCVAMGALAVDEVLAFHEDTAEIVGDDDHLKVAMWLAAGAVLFAICRLEKTSRIATRALLVGYACHSLYLLVELGDGDYFGLPVPIGALKWSEEFFELGCVLSLLVGFVWMHTEVRDAT